MEHYIGPFTALASTVASIVAVVSAVKAYRAEKMKEVKEEMKQHEHRLTDLENAKAAVKYVDQQDRALHHRISGIEERNDKDIREVRQNTQQILSIVIDLAKKTG